MLFLGRAIEYDAQNDDCKGKMATTTIYETMTSSVTSSVTNYLTETVVKPMETTLYLDRLVTVTEASVLTVLQVCYIMVLKGSIA